MQRPQLSAWSARAPAIRSQAPAPCLPPRGLAIPAQLRARSQGEIEGQGPTGPTHHTPKTRKSPPALSRGSITASKDAWGRHGVGTGSPETQAQREQRGRIRPDPHAPHAPRPRSVLGPGHESSGWSGCENLLGQTAQGVLGTNSPPPGPRPNLGGQGRAQCPTPATKGLPVLAVP